MSKFIQLPLLSAEKDINNGIFAVDTVVSVVDAPKTDAYAEQYPNARSVVFVRRIGEVYMAYSSLTVDEIGVLLGAAKLPTEADADLPPGYSWGATKGTDGTAHRTLEVAMPEAPEDFLKDATGYSCGTTKGTDGAVQMIAFKACLAWTKDTLIVTLMNGQRFMMVSDQTKQRLLNRWAEENKSSDSVRLDDGVMVAVRRRSPHGRHAEFEVPGLVLGISDTTAKDLIEWHAGSSRGGAQ